MLPRPKPDSRKATMDPASVASILKSLVAQYAQVQLVDVSNPHQPDNEIVLKAVDAEGSRFLVSVTSV